MGEVLDTVILTCAVERWQKVARIIAQVADRAGPGINFDAIAARIDALVEDDKLEAKGDLSQ
jgi:hypothetical protein